MKFVFIALLGFSVSVAGQSYHVAPEKVEGPDACGECHEKTIDIWKKTHHAKSFKDLPRLEEAREITAQLGVKRIKTAAECSGCHFTAVVEDKKSRAIAGISCESCHGAARDWMDVHSDFGGRDVEAADETPEHKKERYARSEAAGMIRPQNAEALIRNCYSCHMIADEKLVNIGGHPSASAFEIVRWSQGEVRHKVWYTDENNEASPERKRLLLLLGQVLNYEYALRALAKATSNDRYAKAVAKQAKLSERRLQKINTMLMTDEVSAVLGHAANVKLTLNNSANLLATADAVARQASALARNHDGSAFAGLDAILPAADKYKGSVSP